MREAVLAKELEDHEDRDCGRGVDDRTDDSVADRRFDQRDVESLPDRGAELVVVDQGVRGDGGGVEREGDEAEAGECNSVERPAREEVRPRPRRERDQLLIAQLPVHAITVTDPREKLV